MEKEQQLTWKRSEWGAYADSNTELLRYYVEREGRKWTLRIYRTIETSGIRTVKAGSNEILIDRYHETAKLAKATAQAYDLEKENDGPMNRITRAINKGYSA